MMERGVLIEYDFAGMNGAELLFRIAKNFLNDLDGITLDVPTEARYLAGGNYLGALTDLFNAVKTKKTPQKAARDLQVAFDLALATEIEKGVSAAFCNFVNGLVDGGLKVVISTRAEVERVRPMFEDILSDRAVLFQENCPCYGALKWDAWRRAAALNSVNRIAALTVAGSGHSAKAALQAGMGCLGVVNPHVAYQDYTGASAVVEKLDAAAAKTALEIMRID